MKITGHTVEKLADPYGLLSGDRFELFLNIEVDEDDELYSEKGVGLKVIFVIDEHGSKIAQYNFFERGTETVLDFALDEDEEAMVLDYCGQVISG